MQLSKAVLSSSSLNFLVRKNGDLPLPVELGPCFRETVWETLHTVKRYACGYNRSCCCSAEVVALKGGTTSVHLSWVPALQRLLKHLPHELESLGYGTDNSRGCGSEEASPSGKRNREHSLQEGQKDPHLG